MLAVAGSQDTVGARLARGAGAGGGGGGGGGAGTAISQHFVPGWYPTEICLPMELLLPELRPRSSNLRFFDTAGRMKNPFPSQTTGPMMKSMGLVCSKLAFLYLLLVSSAWTWTRLHARRLIPSPHLTALLISTGRGSSGSAFHW